MSYFDEHAHELRRDVLVDKWRSVAALFEGLGPSDVVEVGAGTGLYTLPLVAAGHRVTAVDLSAASLDQLAADVVAAGQLTTVVGDFLTVDLPETDVVSFIKVLHHLPDRGSIAAAITKAWRLVRPGGRVVIFEPNGLSPVWPVVYRLRGVGRWEEEKNLRLIRYRFIADVLDGLGATYTSGFRYLIPGTLTTRFPVLDRIDKQLVSSPIGRVAGNVWFSAVKR